MRFRFFVVLCVFSVALSMVMACGEPVKEPLSVLKDGAADVSVVYLSSAGEGVKAAAEEAVRALSEITGKSFPKAQGLSAGADLGGISTGVVLVVGRGILKEEPIAEKELESLGEEGYLMYGRRLGGKAVFQIASKGEAGIQYGVYALTRRWGVRYFHPSDTYTPKSADLELPFGEKISDTPKFALRGFHHHTQHPIPMSVYLLEPDEKHMGRVKEYVLWLCRNRQNLLQWHFLKTVDVDKWLPYIKKVSELAGKYGVKLGLTISFADQQQNNYRLVDDLKMEQPAQTKAIQERLDKLLSGGFQVMVFQFGTSEFTKVKDDVALFWLNTAAKHMKSKGVPAFAWIHTAGELHADDGKSYYYHLPEKADAAMGAYVHTTMFYDMKNPAPVYSNKDFTHQAKFLDRVLGKRQIVYFPETAWWLGFDNNLPLALPITGYSRGLDILEILKGKDVHGHVTFTTGMEWGYWKYDHYLTRVTWDRKTTWEEYLKDFTGIFGKDAGKIQEALKKWTELQVQHFYKDDPLLYFYVAGELAQDELGQQIGVLARRPKRAFTEIINLKAEDYAKWEKGDFAKLQKMQGEYDALFQGLPKTLDGVDNGVAKKLYNELYTTLKLYTWRVKHAILLYDAVRKARLGRVDKGVGAAPDEASQSKARDEAKKLIDEAKKITQEVLKEIARIEKEVYRYPKEILSIERKSLTSYPFGYLWETSTGHFWVRRDEQAAKLLKKVSGELKEEWAAPAPASVYRAPATEIEITEPSSSLIKQVLASFIPGFFVAVGDEKVADGAVTKNWRIALDHNDNKLPDADTATAIDGGEIKKEGGKDLFVGKIKLFQLPVIDKAGNELGIIGLHDVELQFELSREGDALKALNKGKLRARIVLDNLIAVSTQVAGIDREGLLQILGSLLDFDPKNPPRSIFVTIGFKSFEKL